MNFLIVEDDPKTAKILKDNLQSEGVNIFLATDAYEGHRIALENHIDKILTDVCLPHRSGFAFARALKKDLATKGIPIGIYSSHEISNEDKELAKRYGIDFCLPDTDPIKIANFAKYHLF